MSKRKEGICRFFVFVSVVSVLFLSSFGYAEEPAEISVVDLLFMDIDVITASKYPEKHSDAPGVITVVTKDELERFGGTTLKDVLLRVPGLADASAYFPDRSIVAVRGLQTKESSAHSLLLINGRPIREIMQGGLAGDVLETFPVNIVERVEVIRGPGSVLYGSQAFAGVINVITEPAVETGATVGGLAGGAGAADSYAEAKIKAGGVSVVAAGKYHEKSDWDTPLSYRGTTGATATENTGIVDKGPGGYAEVNFKNLKLMTAYARWDNTYLMGDVYNITGAGGVGVLSSEKRFADVGYRQKLSGLWSMDFNVTYTNSHLNDIQYYPFAERKSYELVTEWANTVRPIEKLNIVAGGLYSRIDGVERYYGVSPSYVISDKSRESHSLYAQADYAPVRLVKVIGGVQANKVQGIALDVVPRAGLMLTPTKDLNIKTLYSEAFRAPSINEYALQHPAIVGNKDLLSEKVGTFDIELNYFKKKFQGSVNFSYSKLRNIIQTNPLHARPRPYENLGKFIARGVEAEAKYSVNRKVLLLVSVLRQETEDVAGAKDISPIATFGAKGGASYRSDNGVTLGLFNSYQGPLDGKYATLLNPSPGSYNIMNLNGRLDVNKLAGWKAKRSWTILVRIDNALDKEIWLPILGKAVGLASTPRSYGRTVYAGIEMSL